MLLLAIVPTATLNYNRHRFDHNISAFRVHRAATRGAVTTVLASFWRHRLAYFS